MTVTPALAFPQLYPGAADTPATKGDKNAQDQAISTTKQDVKAARNAGAAPQSTLECPEMSHFVADPDPVQLSRRQIEALPYLVSSPTLSEAARRANVTRRTLQRWLNNYEFRQEFERLRRAANEIARAEISGLSLKAALVVGEALDDPNSSIRLRAALATLSLSQKSNEIEELQQQIDRIGNSLPLYAPRDRRYV